MRVEDDVGFFGSSNVTNFQAAVARPSKGINVRLAFPLSPRRSPPESGSPAASATEFIAINAVQHMGLGITPNIAPPSSRKVPSVISQNSRSPSFMRFSVRRPRVQAIHERPRRDPFLDSQLHAPICRARLHRRRPQPRASKRFLPRAREASISSVRFSVPGAPCARMILGGSGSRSRFIHSFIFRGHRADNLRRPTFAGRCEVEHRLQFRLQSLHAVAVRFIQNENVGNFHQPSLHILHVVAHAVRAALKYNPPDTMSPLCPTRFRSTRFGRVQNKRDVAGRPHKAAENRDGHRTNEDSGHLHDLACGCGRRELLRPCKDLWDRPPRDHPAPYNAPPADQRACSSPFPGHPSLQLQTTGRYKERFVARNPPLAGRALRLP